MSGTALMTMIVICGFVWGGLVTLILYALKRESAKSNE